MGEVGLSREEEIGVEDGDGGGGEKNLPKWFPIRSAAPVPPIGGHRGGNRRILGLSRQSADFNLLMGEPQVPYLKTTTISW